MHHLLMERNRTCGDGLSIPGLQEKVAFLSDARSYGDAVEKVEVRETHMSWVFLAGNYVFKLKKPGATAIPPATVLYAAWPVAAAAHCRRPRGPEAGTHLARRRS